MSTYRFKLQHVSGTPYEYSVDKRNMVLDEHGHVLAFTVLFDDGSAQHFVAGNDHSVPSQVLSALAAAGRTAGRAGGLGGMVITYIAVEVLQKVGRNVLIHQADYYTDGGRKVFHGPPVRLSQ